MTTRIDVDTLLQRIISTLSHADEQAIADVANQVLPYNVSFDEDTDEFIVSDERTF